MARETICEACQREHHGKPPCLKTGRVCDRLEAELPGADAGRGVGAIDGRQYALAGILSDLRGKARPRLAAMCALYYRCGWTQKEIARAMKCARPNVQRQLVVAERRYAKMVTNVAISRENTCTESDVPSVATRPTR